MSSSFACLQGARSCIGVFVYMEGKPPRAQCAYNSRNVQAHVHFVNVPNGTVEPPLGVYIIIWHLKVQSCVRFLATLLAECHVINSLYVHISY